MGTVTPEERRRIAAGRQAARQAELARMSRSQGPKRTVRRRARGLRVAIVVSLVSLGLTAAWAIWTLASHITFNLPPTFREWLLPPVTSF